MDMQQIFMIAFGAMFINNFVLSRFLGLCPFFGVSKQTRPAVSMGAAVIFVMSFSAAVTWAVYRFVLIPHHIEFLRTIVFILVIAASVQLVELAIMKISRPLHRALGIYLPLITTNCAVLGVTVLNIDMFFAKGAPAAGSFMASTTQSFFAGVGFMLALLLMSGIRERLELSDVPEPLKGLAIAFIAASLMSLAFLGFAGFSL